ncbi:hypothetical protein [Methylobacterium sp. R2-1]|uniref:hypothetical protein n=1 Tax=Methylobacterium sp. R2-1 TaxID=2587064 RepID=UPI0016200287|nr:hypothetical protein [Methylobacterium sp. R2-1]MBB2962179.1 hypothetical protein [Methylobacterium sp. R2-1]
MPHRPTRFRISTALVAAMAGLSLPAAAQDQEKRLAPPASDVMPPVELTIPPSG